MIDAERWLLSSLGALQSRIADDFAGLGFIFYTDLSAIPRHSLVPEEMEPRLPVTTLHDSIDFLAFASRRGSICHDGFHFVEMQTGWITHVSQFLSPPIPDAPVHIERANGARHMAARLTSLVLGVELAAICTLAFEIVTYRQGQIRMFGVNRGSS